MEEKVEIIVINWEKIEFKSSPDCSQKWDCGLYQVYGNHYAYGQNSLLYIGKAANSFNKRLLNDERLWTGFLETTVEPNAIRLGRIVKDDKDKGKTIAEESNWNEYINIAENVLIATHSPALNSQLSYHLNKIEKKYTGKNYLIINLGDRGSLLPEVSTLRNSYRFYTYETPFGQ